MDFQTILNRYSRQRSVNPRASVPFFQGLANQGSFAAAFTGGLLSAQADQAELQDQLLAAALQNENLKLESQKVTNDTTRAEAQNMLTRAQARGADVQTQGNVIGNNLLARYGPGKEAATIQQLLSNAYQAQSSGMNMLATARGTDINNNLTLQYGGQEKQAGINLVQAQTYGQFTNANANMANAATSQFNANTQRGQVDRNYDIENKKLGISGYEATTNRKIANNTATHQGQMYQLQSQQYGVTNNRENNNYRLEQEKYKIEQDRLKRQQDLDDKKTEADKTFNEIKLKQLEAQDKRQTQLFELTKQRLTDPNSGKVMTPYQQMQVEAARKEDIARQNASNLITEEAALQRFQKAYKKSGEVRFLPDFLGTPDAVKAFEGLPPGSSGYINKLLGDDLSGLTPEQVNTLLQNRLTDIKDNLNQFYTQYGDK